MYNPFIDSALLVFLYMSCWFVVAQWRRDNSLADIGWGLGFVLVAWWIHLFYPHEQSLLLAILVSLWGVRLAGYLAIRNLKKGKEDWRYARWREEWGRWAVVRSFLQVFLLQGFFMWVIALPLMPWTPRPAPAWLQFLGVGIWLAGWLWESIADWQLMRFKAKPENQGKILSSGLWAYSRHPNYFGELLVWWGIFISAPFLNHWWLAWLGPLTISWLLFRVSGVPMLEEKYRDNPEYQAYVRRTNAIVPKLTGRRDPPSR